MVSLTAVSKQFSCKIMLVVKSRFERVRKLAWSLKQERAEKKPISSPAASLSPTLLPLLGRELPQPAEIQECA